MMKKTTEFIRLKEENKYLLDQKKLLINFISEIVTKDDVGKIHKDSIVILDRFIFSAIIFTFNRAFVALPEGPTKAMMHEGMLKLNEIDSEYNKRACREND